MSSLGHIKSTSPWKKKKRTETGKIHKNTGHRTTRCSLPTDSFSNFAYFSYSQSQLQIQIQAQFRSPIEALSAWNFSAFDSFSYLQVIDFVEKIEEVVSLIFFQLAQFLLFLACLTYRSRSEFYLKQVKGLVQLLESQYYLPSYVELQTSSNNMSTQPEIFKGKTPVYNDNLATPTSLPVTSEEPTGMGAFDYFVTMPQPGSSEIPYFEDKNITEFLTRYEDMCMDFRVNKDNMIRRLPRYCVKRV